MGCGEGTCLSVPSFILSLFHSPLSYLIPSLPRHQRPFSFKRRAESAAGSGLAQAGCYSAAGCLLRFVRDRSRSCDRPSSKGALPDPSWLPSTATLINDSDESTASAVDSSSQRAWADLKGWIKILSCSLFSSVHVHRRVSKKEILSLTNVVIAEVSSMLPLRAGLLQCVSLRGSFRLGTGPIRWPGKGRWASPFPIPKIC